MDRPRRIRIVAGIGLGLFSLFVAYFGAPLISMLLWPAAAVSGDVDSMMQSMSQTSKAAANTNESRFALFCLLVFVSPMSLST